MGQSAGRAARHPTAETGHRTPQGMRSASRVPRSVLSPVEEPKTSQNVIWASAVLVALIVGLSLGIAFF